MIIRTKLEDVKDSQFDAIIIGSGMGGLACAGALSKMGQKVLVIEQHYAIGGMTHTFKRKGFIWDVGVHALGEMDKKRLPGKIIRWISDDKIDMKMFGDGEHKVYDTFNFPDESFGLPSSGRELARKLIERFPAEKNAINEYMNLINEVGKSGKSFFFLKTQSKIVRKILTPFLTKNFRKWASKTTKEVHDQMFKDDKLKAILAAQWGYYGRTPSESSFYIHAATFRHFWNGAYYPQGSSRSIAEAIGEVVLASGGNFLSRTKVNKILVNKNKAYGVALSGGEKLYASKIIAATSAKVAMENLLPESLHKNTQTSFTKSLTQSPCHICLYLGFDGDITQTEASQSNQWLFETWDHEDMIWDAKDPSSKANCLYVSFPSLKDNVSHCKTETMYTAEVVTFVPWDQFSKWQDTTIRSRGEDYDQFKQSIEDRVIAQMKKQFPKLMEQMTYCETSTPLSTQFYCEVPEGAIYGVESTPKRYLSDELSAKTHIKNYYLSGSDIATCGVVGALMGGILTAATIDKKVMQHIK